MAGRGRAPKDERTRARSAEPERGGWTYARSAGWQHGKMPAPPTRMLAASREAWATWMGSWFAAFWKPEDLPALRQLIRLYDRVERGEYQRYGQLRVGMDTYGITPKGQQDRRWRPPAIVDVDVSVEAPVERPPGVTRREHLRVVDDSVAGSA